MTAILKIIVSPISVIM